MLTITLYLDDVLQTSWRHLFKTSRRRLEDVMKTFVQDILKTFWRRLENVLARRLGEVLETSWKRLEDVLKMSWRCFYKASWRRLAGVLKTSWKRLEDVLKTYDQGEYVCLDQDVLKTSFEDEHERRLQETNISWDLCWSFAKVFLRSFADFLPRKSFSPSKFLPLK